MNDDEKYFFDLLGFAVLRDVMTADQVSRCNAAIDEHARLLVPHERRFEGESKALTSDVRQHWLSGMLAWRRPWCEPFRELLVHPRIAPYLRELLGGGYRLNEGPDLVAMDKGCAGHYMHGGGIERQDFTQTYLWKYGRMHCGMTVVEYMLADEGPGDGGVAVVPGGHKSNYPLPQSFSYYEKYQEFVQEVHVKAGDAVVFTEACTHGTLPWQADHQRRTLIYRYTPGFMAFGRSGEEALTPEALEEMTEEQRVVIHPAG
jgi:ectoine hydroxylase-related dioxygenase (phytanoyl-CoA dioxygenase family)